MAPHFKKKKKNVNSSQLQTIKMFHKKKKDIM